MSLTFTSLLTSKGGHHAPRRPDGKIGRHPQGRLDRLGGARLHRVLAGWPRPAHLPEMEWTHVLLEARPLRPLVRARGPRRASRHARGMARQARGVARLEAPPALGPAQFVGQ